MNLGSAQLDGLTLYNDQKSGEARAIWALLKLLGLPYREIELERTSDDLPILRDNRLIICKPSTALIHLAQRYDHRGRWLPQNGVQAKEVQGWLCIGMQELSKERGIDDASAVSNLQKTVQSAQFTLQTRFEPHLGRSSWLAGANPTIADVACYGHISLRPRQCQSLEELPNVVVWLNRLEKLMSAASAT